MALTRDEVKHIAHLARLRLNDEEVERYTTQLSAILEYVEQLQAVDTTGVEPTAQVTGLENVTRLDEIKKLTSEEMKEIITAAPDSEDNLVKTKSVFE
ncbi:MAG: Asp-tRNA(Asn)/Glu-tRNA(Gln) amidotransferase subunit GatC [Patescibacteria group bacterium]|jgi:aspartyl-tRNA(Asn)/glutamyl-tRNA(Gln) amidotransferase subunit C|nr:Asp-tRNA(Asn)/Glu-tRNA(Gln) amidotransferase subunit GatC [Patescibacteria group bacterium]